MPTQKTGVVTFEKAYRGFVIEVMKRWKNSWLARDLLFRRFTQLRLSENVPDYSTLWRFWNQLEERELLSLYT